MNRTGTSRQTPPTDGLPVEIRSLLARLRRRIRGYIWLQGSALAIAWLTLAFWCALAMDYLPVLAGADEMPRGARVLVLVCVAAMLTWIVYRWILRRAFVPLADRSMAMLLERHHPDFRDSLITSVELAGRTDERRAGFDPDEVEAEVLDGTISAVLLKRTEQQALQYIPEVRTSRVFNLRPLILSVAAALILLVTLIAFYAGNSRAFGTGVRRLYLLRDESWPRQAHIELVGVEAERSASQGGTASSTLLRFRNGRVRVARGAAIRLVVRADARAAKIPDTCTISYRTADGDRGRMNMTRVGRVRDGFQLYHYDGKPFRDILTNVDFDVVGYDHRVQGNRIEVVDRPAVVSCELDCVFPKYMAAEWAPRTVPLTAGTQLPQGTQIRLRAAANKELRKVEVAGQSAEGSPTARLVPDSSGKRRTFQIDIPKLKENLSLDVVLTDLDGIASERPYRVFISAVPDAAPAVDTRMSGIGSAVTPDVAIPFRGTIRDDYGVQRSWIEVAIGDRPAQQFELKLAPGGEVNSSIDFREQRTRNSAIALQAKEKLTLVVKAQDRFDLGKAPNVGAGDHYALDVVTPNELLAMLEARELGLRQRFEQIIEETRETRDMLLRVKTEGPSSATQAGEPGEAAKPATPAPATENPALAARKRVWAVRLLRAQQALLQSQKSAQETLGAAAAFRDIREELINNRVDTEDRKVRLQQQLAEPLERIAKDLFPELDLRLQKIEKRLDRQLETLAQRTDDDPETIALADSAVQQADRILQAMNDVLQNMLNLETYNELLDIVRTLIEEQKNVVENTKKQQKKQVLELLK